MAVLIRFVLFVHLGQGLQDTYSEKDLENAILAELEKFILEMGTDFAFMARQKKITR